MNPAQLAEAEALRRTLVRYRGEARKWLVRTGLLLVASFFAFRRGGSLFIAIGAGLALLAVLAYSMSREATRFGDEAKRKLGLLEATSAAEPAGGKTA